MSSTIITLDYLTYPATSADTGVGANVTVFTLDCGAIAAAATGVVDPPMTVVGTIGAIGVLPLKAEVVDFPTVIVSGATTVVIALVVVVELKPLPPNDNAEFVPLKVVVAGVVVKVVRGADADADTNVAPPLPLPSDDVNEFAALVKVGATALVVVVDGLPKVNSAVGVTSLIQF